MNSLQVKRWMRALDPSQILFEDQRYQGTYLDQIITFIRRKTMYSPKINEELIPVLFRLALAKKMQMTKLVNRILGIFREESRGRAP